MYFCIFDDKHLIIFQLNSSHVFVFIMPAFVYVFARCLLPHFIFLSIAPGPPWPRSGWRSDSDNEVLDHNIPRVTGFSRSG